MKTLALPVVLLFLFVLSSCCCLKKKTDDLDHFLVYKTKPELIQSERVQLKGKFDKHYKNYQIFRKLNFVNPVCKIHEGNTFRINHEDYHFNWYRIKGPEEASITVEFDNQFGDDQKMVIGGPVFLLSPSGKIVKSRKENYKIPKDLDHYKVYTVLDVIRGIDVASVNLKDQFTKKMSAGVISPKFYAVPVSKIHRGKNFEVIRSDEAIVFYDFNPGAIKSKIPTDVMADDQFGKYKVHPKERILLGVPTDCGDPEPLAMDHFMVYNIAHREHLQHPIELENRFTSGIFASEVNTHINFLTPSEKIHDGIKYPILNEDFHANWYEIQPGRPTSAIVNIYNQFGQFEIELGDSTILMTPSGKVHGPDKFGIPDSMNHYLLHSVNRIIPAVENEVYVSDQFVDGLKVKLARPAFFARPVKKVHAGSTFEIIDDSVNILFYDLQILEGENNLPITITSMDQFFKGPIVLQNIRYFGVPTIEE